MSSVVALHGQPIVNDQRAAFMASAEASFDKYVEDYGEEPDSMIWVFGGIRQTTRTGWLMNGDTRGGATSMLALASAVLFKDAIA
jgi:hypothetical protein